MSQQSAKDMTQRDFDLLEQNLGELADDYIDDTPNAIMELMVEYGNIDVTNSMLKSIYNAYILGDSKSLLSFTNGFCYEINERLRAKCEREIG